MKCIKLALVLGLLNFVQMDAEWTPPSNWNEHFSSINKTLFRARWEPNGYIYTYVLEATDKNGNTIRAWEQESPLVMIEDGKRKIIYGTRDHCTKESKDGSRRGLCDWVALDAIHALLDDWRKSEEGKNLKSNLPLPEETGDFCVEVCDNISEKKISGLYSYNDGNPRFQPLLFKFTFSNDSENLPGNAAECLAKMMESLKKQRSFRQ